MTSRAEDLTEAQADPHRCTDECYLKRCPKDAEVLRAWLAKKGS
jgi:hypothetical protein